MKPDEAPTLGDNVSDRTTALVKGAFGTIPGIGSLLGEIVGVIIPNQRLERLEAYCRYLNSQLALRGVADERVREPESVDLFEDGARLAVRALSDERKERIAYIVANGIANNDTTRLHAKRLLQILSEIDDEQIITLTWMLDRNSDDREFYERHRAILDEPSSETGATPQELDHAAIYGASLAHLERLGLTRAQNVEEDYQTGYHRRTEHELTNLGRLLLRFAGIADANEF